MNCAERETPQVMKFKEQSLAFVSQLTIYSRVVKAYPGSHPFIEAAAEKVLAHLTPLTAHGESFRLGVGGGAFSAGGSVLESRQHAVSQFAAQLCSLGVVSLSFSPALDRRELYRFAVIASRPRETVWEAGGICGVLAAAGVVDVEVTEIDPSQLALTEALGAASQGVPLGVWERLALRLSDERFPASQELFAELLAALPAQLAQDIDAVAQKADEETRGEMVRQLAGAALQLFPAGELSAVGRELFRKMVTFVARLSPALRRDFLADFLKGCGFEEWEGAEDPFFSLGSEALSGVLDTLLAEGGSPSSLFLKLVHRMAELSRPGASPDVDSSTARGDLQILFRKVEMERYLPDTYREALGAIVSDHELPEEVGRELADERRALEADTLDDKMMRVIEEVLCTLPSMRLGLGVRQHLAELAIHFLRGGDFEGLARILPLFKASSQEADEANAPAPFEEKFVLEVLDCALLLGRERYPQLRELVVAVGRPFVVPLIERLARAENRSLRRFYFDCLTEMGQTVRDAALERLQDERWYLVRNLVILLRSFPDPEVQRAMRRLVGHPHLRVHTEALKSLVRLHSPGAESLLVQELESKDRSRQLVAVQVAELAPTRDVMQKLLSFLGEGGLGAYNLALKRAVVNTLAAIGDLGVLPYLERLLRSRNLLHPVKHRDLKLEIVRSLGRYQAAAARRLAEEFSVSPRLRVTRGSPTTLDHDWGRT